MIDAWATESHYLDHIAPIWHEMAVMGIAGDFWVHPKIYDRAVWLGIDARESKAPGGTGAIIVASFRDLMPCNRRKIIFLQHGAGQSYSNKNPAYAGGDGRDFVSVFLEPGRIPAWKDRERYPEAKVVEIGVPKLDAWHAGRKKRISSFVGLAFHWSASVCPEARSAFDHYEKALPALREAFGTVVGHAHPRAFETLAPIYELYGIVPVRHFEEVLQACSVLAVDNSSVMYEFASTGRPVVVMNAPWYRRWVNHGMRFWEHADMGPQSNGPEDLVQAIHLAIDGVAKQRRKEVVNQVYTACDGRAATRAVAAIGGWA